MVRFRIGPPRVGVGLSTPSSVPMRRGQVLATDAAAYDKAVPAFDEFRWVMGDGLITSEGDTCRHDRRIVAPLFTRRRVTSHVDAIATAAAHLASGGGRSLGRAAPSICTMPARTMPSTSSDGPCSAMTWSASFRSCEAKCRSSGYKIATRRALSVIRVPHAWPVPANRRADGARRQLWGIVEELIANRRRSAAYGDDLLGLLLGALDPETGEMLDDAADPRPGPDVSHRRPRGARRDDHGVRPAAPRSA